MNLYHLVLFLHICALLVAIGASALVHYSEIRMTSAQTTGEIRPWAALSGSLDKVFPLALLTLVATGAYMVATQWAWNIAWIDVALGGVALLFIGGGFLGSRGKALGRALEGDVNAPVSDAILRLTRDPLTRSVSCANTGVAIGIVFIMVSKPSLAGALATLAIAIIVGIIAAVPLWRGRRVAANARLAVAEAPTPERR